MKKHGPLIHRGDAISWVELQTIRDTDNDPSSRFHSNFTVEQRLMEIAPEFLSLPHFCPWRHGKSVGKLTGKRKRK